MRHPRDRQHAVPPGVTGSQAVPASELLTTLTHELRNLLDGSLRCLGNAERLMSSDEIDAQARDQISTARGALERMSGLLSGAMFAQPGAIGSGELAGRQAIELGEAIEHAVDVSRPLASSMRVEIVTTLDPAAARRTCGPLYPLILNGLRNAVESIGSVRGEEPAGGLVAVVLTAESDGSTVLRIIDDGVGPPAIDEQKLFEYGVTSKPRGQGVGLAVCRSIIAEIEGAKIRLYPRLEAGMREGPEGVARRPGAVLEVTLPPEQS